MVDCNILNVLCLVLNVSELKGKGKFSMISCLRSVTRWPQILTQRSLHNAGQASLERQSHVSGSIQFWKQEASVNGTVTKTFGTMPVSVQISVIVLRSSGAHRIAHRA